MSDPTQDQTYVDVRGWQATVPCRDVLGRDKLIGLRANAAYGVILKVPPGESATLTGAQAGELGEILTAVSRRLPEDLLRSAAVSANLSIARARAGWVATCDLCGTPLPAVARFDIAESNGLSHARSEHPDASRDAAPEVGR